MRTPSSKHQATPSSVAIVTGSADLAVVAGGSTLDGVERVTAPALG